MRVPKSLIDKVKDFITTRGFRIPLYASRVPAGPPSLAADEIDRMVEILSLLIDGPPENYFLVRARGDSMTGAGILDGDYLLVDSAATPANDKIVVASINGEVTVKTLKKDKTGIQLKPENDKYKPINITPGNDFFISGVVKRSFRKH
jgi:DNA polymerase V